MMKTAKPIYYPALAIIIISVLLLAYYLYAQIHEIHPSGPPQGAAGADFRPEESGGPFRTLGTIAVVCGAVSFTWLRFRKKLTSPSPIVRKLGKLLYKVHTFAGWAALLLIVVHGAYFLLTKPQDSNIYSGLAGLLVLAALAGYGLFIKRVKKTNLRFVHRLLSFLWLPILLLHAGGSFISTALATLALWGVVWLAERAAATKTVEGN
jgi:hypothetical protein